ncbi:MAG TPA: AGE family epimerase/isomerase, partial [Spirochaetota bacterium]|nr:AGE family epimerase/isomerase [Spirochaetota bacterium]
MVDGDKILMIGAEMEDELCSRILPFWMTLADGENGGFFGEVASDGTVNTRARKGGILMSRILWTFSRAYCSFPDEKYRESADHVFAFIEKNMWDDEYEGIYYAVNYLGHSLDIKKHLYCESFAIYGLAEYHRAFGNEKALDLAVRIYNRMEESASFTSHGGFLDICDRDWTLYPDLLRGRLFPPKTMNTQLHILEGLTNLYRVYRDERLAKRLASLIEIFLSIIINNKTHHFKLF